MKSPIVFQNHPVIALQDASNEVLIDPARGALILRWRKDGRDIITWPEDAHHEKIRGGNPVLFPFIARHYVDGKIDFWRDAAGVVRSMPMHGFARSAAFTVIEEGIENSLRMRLTDSEATRVFYPFAFQFDVVVTLQSGSRLEIAFETTNTGHDPLPYQAGHHFYLAIPHQDRPHWTLHLPCASWGWQQPDGSITHGTPAADLLRLDDWALVDRFQIQPLESQIMLSNEQTGQRLTFDLTPRQSVPWYDITTWTQKLDSDFYCVEPWLGLPNAIHHGEGLRLVAPGMTEKAVCVVDGSTW